MIIRVLALVDMARYKVLANQGFDIHIHVTYEDILRRVMSEDRV